MEYKGTPLSANSVDDIIKELKETIYVELSQIDLSCYKDSMAGLIRDDIVELRKTIEDISVRQ